MITIIWRKFLHPKIGYTHGRYGYDHIIHFRVQIAQSYIYSNYRTTARYKLSTRQYITAKKLVSKFIHYNIMTTGYKRSTGIYKNRLSNT